MEYCPSLTWVEQRGAFIPNIKPPKNWKTGVERFYKEGGKEKIERDTKNFSDSLETILGKPELKLRWDKEQGLDGISLGVQEGIYLNENECWQEHNLGTKSSLIAIGIILNYYKELSKYIRTSI
ncbi:unnamed protein product [marine sediment metagenome]|uniref:Uncharacterized protein n=1 Tax=marine sediment metagenome TaxID=412755 RepID=X1LME6_9ZZZZ